MLISFLTKGTQRNHIISGSLRLSKTQKKEFKNSSRGDIGKRMILLIKRSITIEKINLLTQPTKNVGLAEK